LFMTSNSANACCLLLICQIAYCCAEKATERDYQPNDDGTAVFPQPLLTTSPCSWAINFNHAMSFPDSCPDHAAASAPAPPGGIF
jgi:hypothetical protein